MEEKRETEMKSNDRAPAAANDPHGEKKTVWRPLAPPARMHLPERMSSVLVLIRERNK